MAEFDVKAAIVCDEIRKEINGKDFIIGVYSGDIVLAVQEGAQIDSFIFSLWIELAIAKQGEHNFKIKVELDKENMIEFGDINIKTPRDDVGLTLPMGPLAVDIARPGVLKISLKMNAGKWRLIRAKRVRFAALKLASVDRAPEQGVPDSSS